MVLIRLDAGEQIGHQGIGRLILFAKNLKHLFFPDGTYGAGGQGNGRGHTKGITRETKFAKEIVRAQDRGNCRWLVFGSGREAHPSFLNIEKRVSTRTLHIDVLLFPIAKPCLPGWLPKRNHQGENRFASWVS